MPPWHLEKPHDNPTPNNVWKRVHLHQCLYHRLEKLCGYPLLQMLVYRVQH